MTPRSRQIRKWLSIVAIVLVGAIAASAVVLYRIFAAATARHHEAHADTRGRGVPNAAVATANPFATEAAASVLKEGGSAVDAAITAALMLGVVDPYNSGLGGGGFALVYDAKTAQVRSFDFRERAPSALDPKRVNDAVRAHPDALRNGSMSVAVPAEWTGLVALHDAYGRLPLARLAAPAIERARDGFAVDAGYVARCLFRMSVLRADPEARRIFLGALGLCPTPGWVLHQPDLARTLEALSDRGHPATWGALVGKPMAEALAKDGGFMTPSDASEPIVKEREPVTGTFLGRRIVSMAPPSSGGIIVVSLLQAYERARARLPKANRLHLWIEASRESFYDRAMLLGDPDFVDAPITKLLSASYADEQAARIDATADLPLADAPDSAQGQHTTHLSVVAPDGSAVSLTQSINLPFGSGKVAPGTGVLLNDEMDDFFAVSANAFGLVGNAKNAPMAGKRPLSSMAPTMIFDATGLYSVVGSPGGSQIPTAVASVIRGLIEGGLDPGVAIHAPRVHHQWRPDHLEYEKPLPDDLPDDLRKKATATRFPIGNVQMIVRTDRGLRAVSDCRGTGSSWSAELAIPTR